MGIVSPFVVLLIGVHMARSVDEINIANFLEITALICEKCGLCLETFSSGIPLDVEMMCDCGNNSFRIVDGKEAQDG